MRSPLTGRRLSAGPAFRRAKSRARTTSAASRATPERALLRGVRGPLRAALERLDRHASRIERAWRRLLRRLEPTADEFEWLAALDLPACHQPLAQGQRTSASAGDEDYRLAVERGARTLMRAGVPEGHALAAVAFYVEAGIPFLGQPAEVRALVRLSSITLRLVAAAYGEEQVAGLRRLDDRERQKLSGDLHDEVGADLIVLKLYVEMIAMELAKGSVAPVGPKLQEALALIAHAIESVRRLTLDLGPAFLDTLGFLPALRSFVRQFSLRTGIPVVLEEAQAPMPIPARHQTVLYRVLRGALSNVAKHSRARHVSVVLRCEREVCVMIIEDDGRGFDVEAQSPERSFGLRAMRERVRSLHGQLAIESRPSRRRGDKSGTRIAVRLPLRKKAA